MDESWWQADRELNPEIVASVIRSQFPEVAARSVTLLGEGWDSEVFEIDRTWVVRFPKRAEVQAAHEKERALLPLLVSRLPIAIPHLELFGEPCQRFPYRFVGYRKLPGTSVKQCLDTSVSIRGERAIARQLGEFLQELHAVDGALEHPDLPSLDPAYLDRPIREAEKRLPYLYEASPPLAARLERFLNERAPPRRPSEQSVLIHGDLSVENILLDPEEERVTGIIDWSETKLGPACGDFAPFVGWRGGRFAAEVLDHYQGPADVGDMEWLRQGAIHIALRQVSYGWMVGKASYVRAGLHALELLLSPQAVP